MVNKKIKRIYWDTAAGTAIDRRVMKAMLPFLKCATPSVAQVERCGNPASLHKEGVEANKAVEEARAKIAKVLFAHPDEIIFTGSGTESDNLAILGTAELATKKHIITTEIEHKAVLEPCRHLQKKGYKITYLKTDKEGFINLKELKESLTKDTFLVSVMIANNEIGTIQPIKEVAKILRHFKKENHLDLHTGQASRPYLHVDACQAPRFLDLNVEKLGVDLLSFNGSKIYGPKGVGVLYVRRGVMLAPIIMGGGQERGLRPGTLNVAGIVGLAEALVICEKEREREVKKLTRLQLKLIAELKKIPDLKINGYDPTVENKNGVGPRQFSDSLRLINNINFSIKDFEGEQLVIELDAKGFAVSSGSACSSHDPINNNVRISFGREVTSSEITHFVYALEQIVEKYKSAIIKPN